MKKVNLSFPDTAAMIEFYIKQRLGWAKIDCIEKKLTAIMTQHQVDVAEKVYGAVVNTAVLTVLFRST